MTELRLRNVDPATVELLRDQAKQNGQRLEPWLKIQLQELATKPLRQVLEELRASREEMRKECGVLPDSVDEIRQDREGRC